MVKIAIIDSGLGYQQKDMCTKYFNLVDPEVFPEDQIGHGSAVLYILNKYCNSELQMFKIFGEFYEVDENILISALERILEEDIDIINLSMGLTLCERKNDLESICDKLAKKGVIIISAFDNDGAISFPAAFRSVIGIDVTPHCKSISQFDYVESETVNIRGFSGVQRLPLPNGESDFFSGTSFVTPYITARVAGYIAKGITTKKEVMNELRNEAYFVYPKEDYSPQPEIFQIQKALIFPFNKEMHSLVKFSEMLSFEIDKVCEIKYKNTVGKLCSMVQQDILSKDFTIEDINSIDWSGDFDTVIMGHLRELSEASHVNWTKKIISQCVKYNKKLYAFDDIQKYRDMFDNRIEADFPKVTKLDVPKNYFGKMQQIHCPVLGIWGSSSGQGKFTLQLKLRRQFLKNGYKVAQLGTEPSAKLFSMDRVYPMGYDTTVKISGYDEILTINNFIGEVVDQETDIVIVGAQSQSVAYSGENLSMFPIGSTNLLYATQPDIIVLCINTYDDIDYIRRTINYLESSVDTKVISLAISPVVRSLTAMAPSRETKVASDNEINSFKTYIINEIGLDCFVLNIKDDADEVFEHCVKILSGESDG